MAEKQLRPCSLYTAQVEGKILSKAIEAFFAVAENDKDTFAIFYAPHKCFLAKHNGKDFEVKENGFDLNRVFEARIFNEVSEMRWLNDPNGNHAAAILSETQLIFDGKTLRTESNVIGGLCQEYLCWGQSTGTTKDDWTEFATARVGAFYVPVELEAGQTYARFTAVEYLRTYEDGNIAVVDERLTRIEGYEPKKESKKNAN